MTSAHEYSRSGLWWHCNTTRGSLLHADCFLRRTGYRWNPRLSACVVAESPATATLCFFFKIVTARVMDLQMYVCIGPWRVLKTYRCMSIEVHDEFSHRVSWMCPVAESRCVQRASRSSSSSNWILMSCQPHRVTSGQSNTRHSKYTFLNSSLIFINPLSSQSTKRKWPSRLIGGQSNPHKWLASQKIWSVEKLETLAVGIKAKDITPSIAWRREAWKEEVLDAL